MLTNHQYNSCDYRHPKKLKKNISEWECHISSKSHDSPITRMVNKALKENLKLEAQPKLKTGMTSCLCEQNCELFVGRVTWYRPGCMTVSISRD